MAKYLAVKTVIFSRGREKSGILALHLLDVEKMDIVKPMLFVVEGKESVEKITPELPWVTFYKILERIENIGDYNVELTKRVWQSVSQIFDPVMVGVIAAKYQTAREELVKTLADMWRNAISEFMAFRSDVDLSVDFEEAKSEDVAEILGIAAEAEAPETVEEAEEEDIEEEVKESLSVVLPAEPVIDPSQGVELGEIGAGSKIYLLIKPANDWQRKMMEEMHKKAGVPVGSSVAGEVIGKSFNKELNTWRVVCHIVDNFYAIFGAPAGLKVSVADLVTEEEEIRATPEGQKEESLFWMALGLFTIGMAAVVLILIWILGRF